MPRSAVEKSFCTTREAASLLGVSVGTVQLWVEKGLLEAWKTGGGHRRVVRDSIERLLHKPAPGAGVTGLVPVAPAQPRGASDTTVSHPSEGTPATALTVMVVEDEASLLRLYEVQVRRWPMHPEFVGLDNGFSALIVLGRKRPDLLILDLHMPEMDGFGMLRVISSTPELSRTRIVVVTGLDAEEVRLRGGLPAGIEILPKPVPFDRLLAIAIETEQQRQHPDRRSHP